MSAVDGKPVVTNKSGNYVFNFAAIEIGALNGPSRAACPIQLGGAACVNVAEHNACYAKYKSRGFCAREVR